MPDYHAMYLKLFSAQADAIDALQATNAKLIRAHQEVEDMLINAPESEVILMKPEPEPEPKE